MEECQHYICQFDLLSHLPYASMSGFAALHAVAAQAPQLPLVDVLPVAHYWSQPAIAAAAGAAGFVVGSAASFIGTASEDEMDDRMLAREVLKMAYHSASWRSVAETAFVPKPSAKTLPIQTFLEQAHALRPQQLAQELQSKGCYKVEDLVSLLERDPELWTRMRMHSGHQQKLLQSIHFSIDGAWPQNFLVPAPITCKSRCDFPQKQKSSCYLLPTATVVHADRRFLRAEQLRAGVRIQSFDVRRSHIANTKVEKCSRESLQHHLGNLVIRKFWDDPGEALYKVTLLDQMMKQYTLIVFERQPLWGLRHEGYSWICAGNGCGQDTSAASLTVGDKLVHYSKKLCAVVEISPWQPPNSTDHRLVHLRLEGIPTIFIDGFLVSASVSEHEVL